MKFTPEQNAVFKWASNAGPNACLSLIARAGSGKTTTLLELALRIAKAKANENIFIGAYNVSIAREMQARLRKSEAPKTVTASTLHSAGLNAVKEHFPNAEVEPYKKVESLFSLIEPYKWSFLRYKGEVVKLVSLAKQHLFHPDDTNDQDWIDLAENFGISNPNEVVKYSQLALARSLEDEDRIDFDDMIYLPVILNLPVFQREWVFIDEAQDLNPARQDFSIMLVKPKGHLVACGDPAQAIFGFTGADSESMQTLHDKLLEKTSVVPDELTLSVSFRCPTSLIVKAQEYVPDIKARKDAPDGEYTANNFTTKDLVSLGPDLGKDDCILCRNNAPIAALAYQFISAGVACRIEGRDIGRKLLTLSRKWKVTTIAELETRLIDYEKRETVRLDLKGKTAQADLLHDTCSTLLTLADKIRNDGHTDIYYLREYISELFGDTPDGEEPSLLTLSTIHKAKGREWKRVFYYGREALQPARWAKQDREVAQERNLVYVAYTRAMETLVEVPLS